MLAHGRGEINKLVRSVYRPARPACAPAVPSPPGPVFVVKTKERFPLLTTVGLPGHAAPARGVTPLRSTRVPSAIQYEYRPSGFDAVFTFESEGVQSRRNWIPHPTPGTGFPASGGRRPGAVLGRHVPCRLS